MDKEVEKEILKEANTTQAEQIINRAIQRVVFSYNAYAPIISSFRIVYSDMVPTMGVDKYARLIVNPGFVVSNQAYAEGIIIHETLHVFFGHTADARSKLAYTEDARHNELANIAEDCAINQFIQEPLPDGAILPSTLMEMLDTKERPAAYESAEYYYDFIMEHMPEQQKGKGRALTNKACATDMANSQAVQDALDKMGIDHISEEEVNSKVMDTAVQISKAPGNQYSRLVDFARQKLEPQIDWRPLLRTTIRNAEKKVWAIHARPTYKRVSKRSRTVLFPKKYGQKVSVSLSFDTSGSITQELVNQFLSEVQGCLKYSEIKECALWHTDVYWYGTPEQLESNIGKVYESGGTSSECVEECTKHCKADLHFTFTDGEWGNDPQKPDGCRVGSAYAIIWGDKNIKEIRKIW